MRRAFTGFLVLSGLVLACKPAPTAAPEFSDADREAIRKAEAASGQAIHDKNWPAFAGSFTENGTLLPPNGAAVTGRAAIEAWSVAFPPTSDFQLGSSTIEGRGDLAYIVGTYSMNLTLPGASAPIADRGKYVSVWRKQANGSWLITYDIFNSDLPAGPMPK